MRKYTYQCSEINNKRMKIDFTQRNSLFYSIFFYYIRVQINRTSMFYISALKDLIILTLTDFFFLHEDYMNYVNLGYYTRILHNKK